MQDWLVMKVKEIKQVIKETDQGKDESWNMTLTGETPDSTVKGTFVMKSADDVFEDYSVGMDFRLKFEKVE